MDASKRLAGHQVRCGSAVGRCPSATCCQQTLGWTPSVASFSIALGPRVVLFPLVHPVKLGNCLFDAVTYPPNQRLLYLNLVITDQVILEASFTKLKVLASSIIITRLLSLLQLKLHPRLEAPAPSRTMPTAQQQPIAQLTEQSSLSATQNLLAALVSELCFARNIFGVDCEPFMRAQPALRIFP